MIEYIYKGFKISYKIIPANFENSSYKADGSVTYLLSVPKFFTSKKFHTEYVTHEGAEHEIKQLIENHVDFELKNFYEMKKEQREREREFAVS